MGFVEVGIDCVIFLLMRFPGGWFEIFVSIYNVWRGIRKNV